MKNKYDTIVKNETENVITEETESFHNKMKSDVKLEETVLQDPIFNNYGNLGEQELNVNIKGQEIEISEVTLPSNDCYNESFQSKEKVIVNDEEELEICKKTQTKTGNQIKEICCVSSNNVDQNVLENSDFEEKIDISEIILSNKCNENKFILESESGIKKERYTEPKWILASEQSNCDNLFEPNEDEIISESLQSNIQNCKICSFQATSNTILNTHITSIHNNIKIIIQKTIVNCQFCNNSFPNNLSLKSHVSKHHIKTSNKNKQECQICFYRASTKYRLKRHILCKHKPEPNYPTCHVCHKILMTNRSLQDHFLKMHKHEIKDDINDLITSKIHSCTLCDFQTVHETSLRTHLYRNHNEERSKINCRFCKRTFLTKASLNNHLVKEHKQDIKNDIYHCYNCSYRTTMKVYLIKHMQTVHTEQRTKKQCRFCDKSFLKQCYLDSHVLKHHQDKIESEIQKCSICSYHCTDKSDLDKHFNTTHKGQKAKRKTCEFCNKFFISKHFLHDHQLKNHKNEINRDAITSKIYSCTGCSYETTHKSSFDRHFNRMHVKNRKKIKCEYCKKTFLQKEAHRNHILKQHENKVKSKIYKCKMCPYVTTNEFDLEKHVKSIHNEQKSKTKTCHVCNKLFVKKLKLDEHLIRYHYDDIKNDMEHFITSKVHECKMCDFITVCKSSLNTHRHKN